MTKITLDLDTTQVKGPDESGLLEIYNSTTNQVIHLFEKEIMEICKYLKTIEYDQEPLNKDGE